MSDSAQTPMAKKPPPAAASKSSTSAVRSTSRGRPAVVAAIGGLLIAAAVGLVLMKSDISFTLGGSGSSAQPSVSFVAKSDISQAAATLTPAAAGALVDDAERCKIPLVSMTISKGTAPVGAIIRIRAGSYVSPYFTVTEGMQRIAMPYPAPYGSGAGTYIVEGNANGAILGLTPTKSLLELPGTQNIPVVWRPVSPC
ncbi:MAG: hypothetical protein E7813_05610 [Bradyrhizobium sp.]|uniref:hypothetical protein n=1 Tax=Bradyrhizobium sp. TaxID=376 RepID=UPI0011F91CC2|nr:hypothetical protein [Bradyrhizobium sp.]THD71486.1 MAG: hypothetical protein E7813_05610 [Bradyrhizobium sp.]